MEIYTDVVDNGTVMIEGPVDGSLGPARVRPVSTLNYSDIWRMDQVVRDDVRGLWYEYFYGAAEHGMLLDTSNSAAHHAWRQLIVEYRYLVSSGQ